MGLQHCQIHVFVILGIKLILLVACIVSCTHGSSEEARCNSNFEAGNPSVQASHCLKTYLTESYFEKYASLIDPDFEEFKAHDLPIGPCEALQDKLNLVPRLSVLHRQLIGEGSHRRLSSSIRFETLPKPISELPAHFCEAVVIERLPSGVFADPFELQHLIQRGVLDDAAVFGDTNLELPSFRSNRSIVEFHMDIGPNIFSGYKNKLEINIQLPLHVRYQPLGIHGFSAVEFGPPDLFLRCNIVQKSHNESCLFASSNSGVESQAEAIVWEVPCGIKKHAGAVSIVTFVSAVVSAFLIVLTSIHYSDTTGFKHLKQS